MVRDSIAHMEAPAEAGARWEITGVRHGGITVSDLDRSLAFYRDLLGLELLWRRLYEEPAILEIVGVPEATGLEIAMLRVPGGEVDVELIEYQGLEPRSGSSPPSHHGTGHFCVFVREIETLHAELAAKWRAVSLGRPGRDDRRPQQGREEPVFPRPRRVHLRVPRTAARCRFLTAPSSHGRPIGNPSSGSTGRCA